jgi:hypothetical protein
MERLIWPREHNIVTLHDLLSRAGRRVVVPHYVTIWVQVSKGGRDWLLLGWQQRSKQGGVGSGENADRPYACGGEVQQCNIPQQSIAIHQHLRPEQYLLPFAANLGQNNLSAVSFDLGLRETAHH